MTIYVIVGCFLGVGTIVDAVVREMQEETGLTVEKPKLCGVKQFPIDGG